VVSEHAQWYVQKGSRVQGPFTCEEVGRFLLLGRVRNTDRVSRDGELWEPVTQVPELIPEALLNLDTGAGWTRFLDARNLSDERRAAPAGSSAEADIDSLPSEGERRDPLMDPLERIRRDWLDRVDDGGAGLPASPSRIQAIWLPWTLLGITLAALVSVLWLNAAGMPGG